jgi:hypothetical protein
MTLSYIPPLARMVLSVSCLLTGSAKTPCLHLNEAVDELVVDTYYLVTPFGEVTLIDAICTYSSSPARFHYHACPLNAGRHGHLATAV